MRLRLLESTLNTSRQRKAVISVNVTEKLLLLLQVLLRSGAAAGIFQGATIQDYEFLESPTYLDDSDVPATWRFQLTPVRNNANKFVMSYGCNVDLVGFPFRLNHKIL